MQQKLDLIYNEDVHNMKKCCCIQNQLQGDPKRCIPIFCSI